MRYVMARNDATLAELRGRLLLDFIVRGAHPGAKGVWNKRRQKKLECVWPDEEVSAGWSALPRSSGQ